jgi:arylsulfatase A-like enzyme
LAAEGVRFTNAASAASTTLASHTSLMTGTWPHTHGVARNGFQVPDENRMLAEVLGEHGFVRAAFIGAAPLDPAVKFNQGFDFYGARYTLERAGQDYPQPLERRAKEVTDAALGWLDREEPEGRLFLFVHYFDCHSPYDAPGGFKGRFRETAPVLADPDAELTRVRRGLREQADPEIAAAAAGLEADYCAEIAYVDRHVGRLVDGLAERGILERALVIVTADHGENLSEHEKAFTHGYTVRDAEIRVPLIVRLPDEPEPGRVLDRLVSGIDVMPTTLELLGLPVPDTVEGVSFASALAGDDRGRGAVFAEATKPTGREFKDDPTWANRARYQCVRTTRWKYARRDPDAREHLWDLAADPRERTDLLAGDFQDTELLSRLRGELDSWRASAGQRRAAALDSADHSEALRALGYVEGE